MGMPATSNISPGSFHTLSILVLSPERPMLNNDPELEAPIPNGSGSRGW